MRFNCLKNNLLTTPFNYENKYTLAQLKCMSGAYEFRISFLALLITMLNKILFLVII